MTLTYAGRTYTASIRDAAGRSTPPTETTVERNLATALARALFASRRGAKVELEWTADDGKPYWFVVEPGPTDIIESPEQKYE